MLPFRRIIFPVDYSEPCAAVVPFIKDLMRQCEEATHLPVQLTLVHAYGAEALAYSELPIADPALAAESQAREEERLREFAARMFEGQHVTCVAGCGEPGSVIQDLVQHQSSDLVMLPTHGRGPVRRFLLGSVTTKVLHDVSAAVWTGTETALAGHASNLPYHSILCALDGSPEAECVLRAAATFAKMYGAALSLLRVVEPMPASEFDMMPYQQDRIEAAHFSLRELAGTLDVNAPRNVIEAAVAEGVSREAARLGVDLVIAGRGHAQGVFTTLRSHLYQIVREAPCPVLSI
jgi:nucleotide-binding universal stress UspA family protein